MDMCLLLRRHGMPFTHTELPPVFSSNYLAAVSHTPGRNVVKPVLVWAGSQCVLCVVPACKRVSLDAVAELFGAETAWIASEPELMRVFADCELGAHPPIGRPYGIPVVMDASLCEDEYVVFLAGKHTEAIRMLRADYERLAEPMIADITRTEQYAGAGA